ncbi:Glycosyl transferase, group 1 [Francisella cf. novicida Fx1]|uniref:glycosyltransferase family 4 protein n=1 Tax=Francisella tularensis TaxID=263 RepID=UPI00020BCE5E|nr:glycosyltransferase family 4 protein [Francisella tularensis]AEE87851.1 Glycosyl transferase, group 1 [Francisella cf. novicida Fx1]
MKKHILIVSQYFYPENFRVNDLAVELYNRGYEVTVLTGIPNYPKGSFFDGYGIFKKRKENYHNVNIVRIPIVSRGSCKLRLALNYLSFVVTGYIWRIFTRLKPDYVFIYEVSPMTQALPAVSFAKKRKIPCYIYVTDLWPESVEVVLGLKNKLVLKYLNKMVDYIYKNCDKVLTSSNSFIKKIASRDNSYNDKLIFWPQYAERFYSKVENRNQEIYQKYFKGDDCFKIIFAGNVGEAQNLGLLVDVAKKLKSNKIDTIKFYIVGDGRYKEELVKKIKVESVERCFKFIERQPAEDIKYFMFESDVALISLSKSEIFSMTIPAKTQSCLACGIPILVSADGEIQNVVKEANAGLCSDANDNQGLYNNIVEISNYDKIRLSRMAENALKYSVEKFNKNKLMEELDDLFK